MKLPVPSPGSRIGPDGPLGPAPPAEACCDPEPSSQPVCSGLESRSSKAKESGAVGRPRSVEGAPEDPGPGIESGASADWERTSDRSGSPALFGPDAGLGPVERISAPSLVARPLAAPTRSAEPASAVSGSGNGSFGAPVVELATGSLAAASWSLVSSRTGAGAGGSGRAAPAFAGSCCAPCETAFADAAGGGGAGGSAGATWAGSTLGCVAVSASASATGWEAGSVAGSVVSVACGVASAGEGETGSAAFASAAKTQPVRAAAMQTAS